MIKWLKKWSYMIMLVGTGAVYLNSVDNWQVYAKPLMRIQSWYEDSGLGNLFAAGGGITEGGGSENSAGGQEGAAAGEDTGSGAGESGNVPGTGDVPDSDPAQNPGEGPSVVGEEGSHLPGEEGLARRREKLPGKAPQMEAMGFLRAERQEKERELPMRTGQGQNLPQAECRRNRRKAVSRCIWLWRMIIFRMPCLSEIPELWACLSTADWKRRLPFTPLQD